MIHVGFACMYYPLLTYREVACERFKQCFLIINHGVGNYMREHYNCACFMQKCIRNESLKKYMLFCEAQVECHQRPNGYGVIKFDKVLVISRLISKPECDWHINDPRRHGLFTRCLSVEKTNYIMQFLRSRM